MEEKVEKTPDMIAKNVGNILEGFEKEKIAPVQYALAGDPGFEGAPETRGINWGFGIRQFPISNPQLPIPCFFQSFPNLVYNNGDGRGGAILGTSSGGTGDEP